MAGNYTSGNDIGSYSHPQFTTQNQAVMFVDGAPTTAVNWACFASRNKVIVNRVYLRCTSSPSATAGSMAVHHNDTGGTVTTLANITVSACSAGWNTTMTLTEKTLETITQFISLVNDGTCDKGNWLVVYDYQVLFPGTYS